MISLTFSSGPWGPKCLKYQNVPNLGSFWAIGKPWERFQSWDIRIYPMLWLKALYIYIFNPILCHDCLGRDPESARHSCSILCCSCVICVVWTLSNPLCCEARGSAFHTFLTQSLLWLSTIMPPACCWPVYTPLYNSVILSRFLWSYGWLSAIQFIFSACFSVQANSREWKEKTRRKVWKDKDKKIRC